MPTGYANSPYYGGPEPDPLVITIGGTGVRACPSLRMAVAAVGDQSYSEPGGDSGND